MKKTFVCIFTGLKDQHLIQNIGQIGNSFAEITPLKPIIVCYGNEDYPSLLTETKNQSIHRLKDKGKFLFFEKAILGYLRKEGRKIDFLQLQHLNKADIYQVLLYKLVNPKGKVFLKLDINLPDYDKKRGAVYSKNKFFNSFHKFFEKIALRKINLIAADSQEMLSAYKSIYPYTKDKLIVLSQNLNDKYLDENFPNRKTFEQKENIILTTGRIGAADKNYEMLLETLPLLDLQDWKVIFVGGIQNNFDKKAEKLLTDYPHLKGKVELTGYVDDRLALYEYYNRSKIFCLSSVLESFGVSYIEALYFGNYIVGTTGMTSFDYISNYGELGEKVEVNNRKELATCLNKLIHGEMSIANIEIEAKKYASENFYISKNIQQLKRLIS